MLQRGRKPCTDGTAVAEQFLNVPYYWGGRSAHGIDCSGLVQIALQACDVLSPRDSGEQEKELGTSINDYRNLRSGDLVFFGARGGPPGHVGVGLGGGYYAHCRRHVRINSVDKGNPLHDNELEPQMMGWRRPRKRSL